MNIKSAHKKVKAFAKAFDLQYTINYAPTLLVYSVCLYVDKEGVGSYVNLTDRKRLAKVLLYITCELERRERLWR